MEYQLSALKGLDAKARGETLEQNNNNLSSPEGAGCERPGKNRREEFSR